MLRAMRDDFKKYSWTLWLVIIAFILGFSMTDIFTRGSKSQTVIAMVGDTEIDVETYQKQLFQLMDNYKTRIKGQFNKDLIVQMGIPEQILQTLINAEIIQAEADRLNLRSTEGELKEMIMSFPAFQKDGKFVGISEYKRYLAIFRTNAKDFEADLRKDIINDKLKQVITSPVVIDPGSLRDLYRKENDSAELEYVKLDPGKSGEPADVPEDEVSAYYEKHKDSFKTPEKRQGKVVALKYEDLKKDLTLTEKDYYDYFREKKDEFMVPEKTRIYRIFMEYTEAGREDVLKQMQELRKGLNVENFEDQARIYSTDAKKENGGDWGYSEWKGFTSQEQSIINSLSQGEISDPVDTFKGFSVLFAREKTAQTQEPYETAKPKIKNMLEKEELRNLALGKLKKLYEGAKKSGDLSSLTGKEGIRVLETGFLASGDPVKDVEQFGYLSRKLFSMNEKDIEYPVEFIDGIAVLQLTGIREPEHETLENVREQIRERIVTDRKIAKTIEESAGLTASLNGLGGDKQALEDFLKKQDLKLDTFSFKRGGDLAGLGESGDLDQRIFSLEENRFSAPFRAGDNVVVVRAREIKVTSEDDFNRDRMDFYRKKLEEERDNYFVSYVLNKRAQYDVRVNRELYDRVREAVVSRFN